MAVNVRPESATAERTQAKRELCKHERTVWMQSAVEVRARWTCWDRLQTASSKSTCAWPGFCDCMHEKSEPCVTSLLRRPLGWHLIDAPTGEIPVLGEACGWRTWFIKPRCKREMCLRLADRPPGPLQGTIPGLPRTLLIRLPKYNRLVPKRRACAA